MYSCKKNIYNNAINYTKNMWILKRQYKYLQYNYTNYSEYYIKYILHFQPFKQ